MKLYRDDLLREEKRFCHKDLRQIASETKLSVNTIRNALDGKPSVKNEHLKTLCDYFNLDWLHFHDLDNKLKYTDFQVLSEPDSHLVAFSKDQASKAKKMAKECPLDCSGEMGRVRDVSNNSVFRRCDVCGHTVGKIDS